MDNVADSSMFIYSAGLLFAGESLLKHASIYLEDKKLLAEIEAHLERVEQFHNTLIEEHKRIQES